MATFGEIARKAIFWHGSTIGNGAMVTIIVLVGAGHWGLTSVMELWLIAGSTYCWYEVKSRIKDAEEGF